MCLYSFRLSDEKAVVKRAVFARSAKFSAKFTERGGAASGMKTPFPKCHPITVRALKTTFPQCALTTYLSYNSIGAVFGGDLGVNKSKQLMDRRHLLTTDCTTSFVRGSMVVSTNLFTKCGIALHRNVCNEKSGGRRCVFPVEIPAGGVSFYV